MKANAINMVLLPISATADFLSAWLLDTGGNVELGELEGINDFYTLLHHSEGNGSYKWVDVPEYEALDKDATLGQCVNPWFHTAGDLVPRQDMCEELSGITRSICYKLPSCRWFWGAGRALGIYYLPRSYTTFLNVSSSLENLDSFTGWNERSRG